VVFSPDGGLILSEPGRSHSGDRAPIRKILARWQELLCTMSLAAQVSPL
jgi:hypothetical protein